MVNPVPGWVVTTGYGVPGGWCGGSHKAYDYACSHRARVVAAVGGVVTSAQWGSSFGIHLVIDNDRFSNGDPGLWAAYCHLDEKVVSPGQRVEQGQLIGYADNTGNSTGTHVHFEVQGQANWVCGGGRDPARWVNDGSGSPEPSDWMFPDGHKVYGKYLKWKGHEQNDDGVSDSIKAWQEMLNKHPLEGGRNLPVTGQWFDMTDEETRKCQTQHIPPADDPGEAYVGPGQFDHVKSAVSAPYTFVEDTTEQPEPPPEPPPVELPGPPPLMPSWAVWNPITNFPGLRPFTGTAKKVTLHTTETDVKPNWEAQQKGIPHFTLDPTTGELWQHLPLDLAAYTLQGGENSPNSDSGLNIQIEMVGFADDTPEWSAAEYEQVTRLLEWINDQLGVPLVFPQPFMEEGAPRLSWDEWEGENGVLGHQHVPYNDHYDPGAIRVDLLLPPEPPTNPPSWLERLRQFIEDNLAPILIIAFGVLLAILLTVWITDNNRQEAEEVEQQEITDLLDSGYVPASQDICVLWDTGAGAKAWQVYSNRYYGGDGDTPPTFTVFAEQVEPASCG